MMNKFEEIRQARHDLEMLSASDPAVSANMLRCVAAYSLMITGRLFDEATVLRLGLAYEQATSWEDLHPKVG